jgi:predicted nucleic acid-binding protein
LNEVLDSRFFVEHFYSSEEEIKHKTTNKLKELIRRNEGLLPTVVIAEVFQIVCEKVGRDEAEACYLSLIRSGLRIQGLDQNISRQAGLLKCRYRNIPIGDCIIAATAIINQAKVLSDDTHFDEIKEVKRIWI